VMRLVNTPGRIVGGRVMFEGNNILEIPEPKFTEMYRWKKLAMIFQGSMNGFTPVFTVGNQINEVMSIHGQEGGQAHVARLLRMVDLDEDIGRRYPHELSGGQKQRAFIAMALALSPQLLIADEPTTALDVITQANVINLLKSLRKEFGISIMLITHDLALISEAADRVYIMYAGKVVETGPLAEFFGSPRHPYSQGLLKSTPTLKNKQISGIPGFMPDLANLPPGCSFHLRCPYAFEKCQTMTPELTMKDGERIACWLY
jgi:peptide/nickel transport system ATP-binding protein